MITTSTPNKKRKVSDSERQVNKLFISNILIRGPYTSLVTNAKEYRSILKWLAITDNLDDWLADNANACVHKLSSPKAGLCCIVAVRDFTNSTLTYNAIVSTLCHESVHVFQAYCEEIGEHRPSYEFQAYSTEAIFRQLVDNYFEKFPGLVGYNGVPIEPNDKLVITE